jgi:hypothetical protein
MNSSLQWILRSNFEEHLHQHRFMLSHKAVLLSVFCILYCKLLAFCSSFLVSCHCQTGRRLYSKLLHICCISFLTLGTKTLLKSAIFTKMSCELNCASNCFSCNLDLAGNQSPQGISCDIFDKWTQPEYAGIERISMAHVNWNISITGNMSSQFLWVLEDL